MKAVTIAVIYYLSEYDYAQFSFDGTVSIEVMMLGNKPIESLIYKKKGSSCEGWPFLPCIQKSLKLLDLNHIHTIVVVNRGMVVCEPINIRESKRSATNSTNFLLYR
ncbi:hypothetical protein SAMN05216191_11216 [Paenibacillus jilunlii]|uniref:Uncharacterized protein n=1 Tax=Paenibacillus jilunlii TaxID=682956 RepID=A0A1G9SPK9_9BACL|nr:hypothetical protein AML91_13915 [Paenibacillus jilunlii]SDM37362.1 hypothetical protein SAMN05216191_11216 [Paenibacillus jilunlii]